MCNLQVLRSRYYYYYSIIQKIKDKRGDYKGGEKMSYPQVIHRLSTGYPQVIHKQKKDINTQK